MAGSTATRLRADARSPLGQTAPDVAGLARLRLRDEMPEEDLDVRARQPGKMPWAGVSDEDILTLIANAPSRREKGMGPLRSHYERNLVDAANALRRAYNEHRSPVLKRTWAQLAIGRGVELGERTPKQLGAYSNVVSRRYLAAFAEVGLIRFGNWISRAGDPGGMWVELLDPAILADSRRDSSVGGAHSAPPTGLRWQATTVRLRESREEAQKRRTQPWRRRHDEPHRYATSWSVGGAATPRRSSSGLETVATTGDPPGYGPTALHRGDPLGETCVHAARGAPAPPGLSDANDAWLTPQRGAALEALRRELLIEGTPLERLRLAARGGGDPVVVCVAAWQALLGTDPQLSDERAAQLERSARQADRVACWGRGQVGAGAELVLAMIEHEAAARGADPDRTPTWSLGKFVCELRSTARAWRRTAHGKPPVRDTGQRDRRLDARRDEARRRQAAREGPL